MSQTFHPRNTFSIVTLFQASMKTEGQRCTAAGSFDFFTCISFDGASGDTHTGDTHTDTRKDSRKDTRKGEIVMGNNGGGGGIKSVTDRSGSKERMCDPGGSGRFDGAALNCSAV